MSILMNKKGGDSNKKKTLVESLLLQKSMGIVRMFIQIVKMSLQISKLKKEELALRS